MKKNIYDRRKDFTKKDRFIQDIVGQFPLINICEYYLHNQKILNFSSETNQHVGFNKKFIINKVYRYFTRMLKRKQHRYVQITEYVAHQLITYNYYIQYINFTHGLYNTTPLLSIKANIYGFTHLFPERKANNIVNVQISS